MELNFISILYISFRLAPFILVCYFSLSSLFSQDFKAIIYLAGLLIACFITLMFGKIKSLKNALIYDGNSSTIPDVCTSLSLTGGYPFSILPLSQTVFSFTFFYLLFIIIKYNLASDNIPTLVIFPILIIADLLWNIIYKCSTFTGSSLSLLLGGGFGALWAYIIDQSNAVGLQYFNGLSNRQVCSRPTKQRFKCSNININGQLHSKDNDDRKHVPDDVLTSTELYPNAFNLYGDDSKKELSIPGSGVYIITVDANKNQDPFGVYSFIVSGTKGDKNIFTTTSDILIDKMAAYPFKSASSKTNGIFTISSSNVDHKNCMIYFKELYTANQKVALTTSPVNINNKSGGSLKTFTMPSSGLFFVTIDGSDKPLSDSTQIYTFYVMVSQADNANISNISELNHLGSKTITINGETGGKFNAVITNGSKTNTNYTVYYNQLYGNDANSKELVWNPVNINTLAKGSAHTFTIPSSGLYIITVDGSDKNNISTMYSFYIYGALESNNLCTHTDICNHSSFFKIECLANGQFSVSFTNPADKSTTAFNVFYNKIYP